MTRRDPRLGFRQLVGRQVMAREARPKAFAPVDPRAGEREVLRRPGRRDRNQPPPTSGNRPIPVSGMANRVFSVATRNLAGCEMPTPPPMVIPSMKAAIGLG
jgi:hypothetical protein